MLAARIWAGVVIVGATSLGHAQWNYQNLHPAGAVQSWGFGVDAYQEAGSATANFINSASVWTGAPASWVNMHPTGPSESWVLAVENGTQVGYVQMGLYPHASLWTGTSGSWVDLNPSNAGRSLAYDVAGNQQVGVAGIWSGTHEASIWFGTAASRVSLHPSAAISSYAYGTDGTRQAGDARLDVNGPVLSRAALWTGTAASWVNLHPSHAYESIAWDVYQSQQAGYAVINNVEHAFRWSGNASSWIDLHPTNANRSRVFRTHGGYQVGVAEISYGPEHAAIWSGYASSFVDLHAYLPSHYFSSEARAVYRGSSALRVVGRAYNTQTARWEAILWHRKLPNAKYHYVSQIGLTFDPVIVEAEPGDVIRWLWSDGDHTITSGEFCEFDHIYLDEPLNDEFRESEFIVPAGVQEIRYFSRNGCAVGMEGLIIVTPKVVLGDLSCDGRVDFGDINPFILALSDPVGYEQQYPGCPFENRDVNADGLFDFNDINPFIALLTG